MTDAAAQSERAPVSSGGAIAHYQLISRLGEGGMGVVYRAMDTKLRREVALKVLHPRVAHDADRRRRFVREGRMAAHLTHPCIATVYDVGEADDRVYIAMELVGGDKLADLVSPERPMYWTDALQIIHEVVRGLHKAHEVGIIHRDLKPDNLMVGDEGIVKILDFGVAKPLEKFEIEFSDIKTQHGSLIGTPAYMSPEQAAGKEVDPRSDIFSVGVVMYELVTGLRPFEGETWQEIIIAINRDAVMPASEIVSDVPAEVEMIISRCMAKNADDRYPSCKELLADIAALVVVGATGTITISPGSTLSGILNRAGQPPITEVALTRQRTTTIAPPSTGRTMALVGVAAAATLGIGMWFINPNPVQPNPVQSVPAAATAVETGTAVVPTTVPSPASPAEVASGAPSAVPSGVSSAAASGIASTRPTPRPPSRPVPKVATPSPKSPAPVPKPKSNPVLGF